MKCCWLLDDSSKVSDMGAHKKSEFVIISVPSVIMHYKAVNHCGVLSASQCLDRVRYRIVLILTVGVNIWFSTRP